MFEEKAEKIQKARVYSLPDLESRRKKKRKEKLRLYLKCFSVVFASGAAVGGILFGQARLVEYNSQIAACTCELEEIKSTNEQLEIKLSAINTSKESYNKDKCVEIITVAAGDKAEIK